ncbi:hypothetical protein LSCM1_07697 [Leishmania martiniquensis]|uniref:RanBP2-type domain-containing protein n=1 Tax=Leishmania martiniquensis TaxID=1580590 RepID=A0A836I2A7_9TRYP|nr:hypothetical protein LSCM1_07697 [Leishmania martiniquensis]
MYLRKPLVQRGTRRRHPHRCHERVPTATRSAPLWSSGSGGGGSDFARYTEAELADTVFTAPLPTEAHPAPVEQRLASSFPLAASTAATGAQRHRRRRSLHCGNEVSSLPPTRAILNHLNSSLWLQVLACLHRRGALSSEDYAGAIRYLPAFTYRPLMPWLWTSPASSIPEGAAQHSNASHRNSEAESWPAAWNRTGGKVGKLDWQAEVHSKPPLATSATTCRPAAPLAPPAPAPLTAYTVTDMSTAAPAQWADIATSVVRSELGEAPPATAMELLKIWHGLFFALRSHTVWASTPEQLRDCAHPQIMRMFECFYADVKSYSRLFRPNEALGAGVASSEELQLQQWRDDVTTEVAVRTLTPPILLRNLRSLYRLHRNSAMLFAELYAMCIKEEEAHLHLQAFRATSLGSAPAEEGHQPITRTQRQKLTTTALLMDVDLAAYYATLPGRRHSGLSDAGEQWSATLQHLRFLLPRVHLLQCARAQRVSLASSKNIADEAVWQPWRQVASIIMNVCVWVSNNNGEAERCADALRCTIETLRCMCAQSSTAGRGSACKLLTPPTSRDVSCFISCLVEAARDSMRAKAAQLHYGPMDGLLGVYLLSVAVSAVVPASVPSHKSRAECQQTGNGVSLPSANATDGAVELLQRLRLLFHASKSTPREVWAALHRFPGARNAARYGLVTVGYRLFSDCVVPLASQPKSIVSAWRLWGRLRAWATEVGRPLGLRGEAASVLWKVRWLQEQDRAPSALWPRHSTDSDNSAASALLRRLTSGGVKARGDAGYGAPETSTQASPVSWRCGCGFENGPTSASAYPFDVSSLACAACVLRTLAPLSWECPSCHAVACSGVSVPYCLRCEAAHPLADQLCLDIKAPNAFGARACGVASCKGRSPLGTVALRRQSNLRMSTLCPTAPPPLLSAWGAAGGVARCCWDCGRVCDSAPANVGGVDVAPLSSTSAAPFRYSDKDALLDSLRKDDHSLRVEDAGTLVYVCSDCHAISAGPHGASSLSVPGNAPAPMEGVKASECDIARCSLCGSTEPGYYTTAFSWACNCGARNAALHAYCHACSRAAQQPAVTCTHCSHAQPVRADAAGEESRGECERCHHPHPRALAAIHQHRLVRCPACQGRVLSTSLQCPHCASTAVAAVAALLPTEADQPWVCHHCGTAHAIRGSMDGELRPPAHLAGVSSSRAPLQLLLTHADDDCCTTCSTRRLPAATWERGRLWGCSKCGEPHNCGLACRRCCALAPGVPGGEVYVWRCAACDAYHPSWETQCQTTGCGARKGTVGAYQRFCYSPWRCAECGGVTLSSHAAACASCGTETPLPLRDTPCTYADACATAANAEKRGANAEAHDSAHAHEEETTTEVDECADGGVQKTSGGACATRSTSPADPLRVQPPQHAETTQVSRLAEVEALLLQAAAHPTPPLLTCPLDTAVVEAVSPTSRWPRRSGGTSAQGGELAGGLAMAATDPTHRNSAATGGDIGGAGFTPEPWEDAYAAMVTSYCGRCDAG